MSFRMVHLWFSNKKYMVNWHLASLLIEKTKICISGETIPIIFPEKTNAMTLEFTSISNFYHFPFFVMTTIQIIWKLMRLTNNFHFHLRFIVFLCISLSKIHHHVKREAQSKRFLTYGLLQDKWESNKVVTQEVATNTSTNRRLWTIYGSIWWFKLSSKGRCPTWTLHDNLLFLL